MRKGIILGIGILILLLALAGTGSAKNAYGSKGADCGFCHVAIVDGNYALTDNGNYFRDVHKFDGYKVPSNASSCLNCHTDLTVFLPLTPDGSLYNVTHRYNGTTLAAKMLPVGGCNNCHVNAAGNNFNLLSGTPTYLTSTVCQDCHKAKYDQWQGTFHRVMLTPKDTAQAMNVPTPKVGWSNISYVIITKSVIEYINTTGYFPSNNSAWDNANKTWEKGHSGEKYGTCARCHTVGYNQTGENYSGMPGITGTWVEPGIGCERCHGAAGNGHQVVIDYSPALCQQCHSGGTHGTNWEKGGHAPPALENGSCMFCHSPIDQYKNPTVTIANAKDVVCSVCHNVHNLSDEQYGPLFSPNGFNAATMADEKTARLSFFNATASSAASADTYDTLVIPDLLYPGTNSERKDSSYGTAPISVAGAISNDLCSKCHFRHGLTHIAAVNLSHGTFHSGNKNTVAACIDCHMEKAGSDERMVMRNHDLDPLGAKSCGGATRCHTTSAQNLSKSSHSVIPVIREWNASAHNDRVVGVSGGYNHFFGTLNKTTGVASSRPNSCNKCHSPINWNPLTDYYSNGTPNTVNVPLTLDNFKGITCDVCHNIHDMGDWLAKTKAAFGESKAYGWYNRDAVVAATNPTTGAVTRYKANYTMMSNTTELCGNCHSNIRIGSEGPGWASATAANPISPHGFPAKDIFVGSWKQTGLLNFECIDCHMATMTTDSNGNLLPDSQKVNGHSFKVNETLLQSNPDCSSCHVAITGSTTASKHGNLTVLFTPIGNISQTIAGIQAKTQAKWNTTNATVMSALNTIKAYNGEKNLSRTLIAQAYWNLRLVSSDESWGVHNPTKINQLLDDAVRLANEATASLAPTAAPALVSSITPNSRNAQVGTPVTISMSVKNYGTATAKGVSIAQAPPLEPVTVSYQQWSGTAFTGTANTPADLAAGATANYVLTITATSAFTTSPVTFNVSGTNAAAAPISGVNTLTMAATTPSTALADVIMISTNLNVSTAVNTSTTFAVATSNVGANATGVSLIVSVPSSITGLAVRVNQTNPTTGAIIGPATGLTIGAGAQPTFAVFLTPTQKIAFDPTNNRITLQLKDDSGNVFGTQTVAISTT